MKANKWAVISATAILAITGVSTGNAGSTMARADSATMKRIGFVQIDLSNPFHVAEVRGAQEAARRLGFTLLVRSGDGDVQKQVAAFEGLINDKVDAIAVNAIDINAFAAALAKAKDAGIPVVSEHTFTPLAAVTLGFSEYATGQAVGVQAASLLKKRYGKYQGTVAILQGLLGQGLNATRTGGFVDALKKYPNIKVVAKEPTNWDPQKASSITENFLTKYPKLDMIYGISDSLTLPAYTVVKRHGKTKQVILVSVDGTKDGIDGVTAKKLSSTFLYAPEYSGFWKAWTPWRLAMGQKLPATIDMSGVLVTGANVAKVAKLTNDISVDIENFPFEKSLPQIYKIYAAK